MRKKTPSHTDTIYYDWWWCCAVSRSSRTRAVTQKHAPVSICIQTHKNICVCARFSEAAKTVKTVVSHVHEIKWYFVVVRVFAVCCAPAERYTTESCYCCSLCQRQRFCARFFFFLHEIRIVVERFTYVFNRATVWKRGGGEKEKNSCFFE